MVVNPGPPLSSRSALSAAVSSTRITGQTRSNQVWCKKAGGRGFFYKKKPVNECRINFQKALTGTEEGFFPPQI